MTERQKPGILVCGDVAIDWIDFPRRPETRPDGPHQPVIFPNWKLYPGIRRKSVLGGHLGYLQNAESHGRQQG